MLSSDSAVSTLMAARSNGAVGFVTKGTNPAEVIDAVREVARGGSHWPQHLA
jgi:DNA-binding NarL/FixJ family response regulator